MNYDKYTKKNSRITKQGGRLHPTEPIGINGFYAQFIKEKNNMVFDKKFKFRLNDAHIEKMERDCKETEKSFSEHIRDMIMDYDTEDYFRKKYYEENE